jgi:hypothetical protein
MSRVKRITPANCKEHHGDMFYSGIRICPQCKAELPCGKDTVQAEDPKGKEAHDKVLAVGV